jgi:hypothetical protein
VNLSRDACLLTLGLARETQILISVAVVIVVVALGGSALLMFRRRLFDKGGPDPGGLLDSLRAMRDRGQITPAEFDAARKRMAAKMAGVAPPPSAAPRAPARDPALRTARPGFDLTGAPLPTARPGGTTDKPDEKPGGGGGSAQADS